MHQRRSRNVRPHRQLLRARSQEAAAHAKYRKAVRASESRLLARSNPGGTAPAVAALPARRGLPRAGCNDCEEEGEECEETGDLSALALGDDDDDESSDEESALQRMRAARLAQLREGAAVAAARKKEGFGAYAIVAGEALGPMLESGPPAVVHIASPDYTDDAGLLATLLADAAPRYPAVRFVGVRANPDCMPFVRELPALLLVHNGVIESTAEQVATLREPARLRAHAEGWLEGQLRVLALIGDDSDDDDGEEGELLRPKGLRNYPHEHVAWGVKNQQV